MVSQVSLFFGILFESLEICYHSYKGLKTRLNFKLNKSQEISSIFLDRYCFENLNRHQIVMIDVIMFSDEKIEEFCKLLPVIKVRSNKS